MTPDGLAPTMHFLRDDDFTSENYLTLLQVAIDMKNARNERNNAKYRIFNDSETICVIFDKNSTRTRLSFATAITELGATPLIIDSGTSQLSRGEPISDTAHVMERMCKAIVWRTFKQSDIEMMAVNSSVPVVNALTDDFHPCQVLADLAAFANIGSSENLNANGSVKTDSAYSKLSSKEKVHSIQGKTVAYLGDASNNMAHSYLLGCVTAGLNIQIGCPKEFMPNPQIIADAKNIANENGVNVLITNSAKEALSGADLVTTDAWISMGTDESEKIKRKDYLLPYQINVDSFELANDNAIFMHCLPAYRGQEVTSDIIDGKMSAVFEEAEFRVHAQKALLYTLLKPLQS